MRRLLLYNEPVPRNAILVTFDHGRRTSYFGTKSHLRRAGWRGVMFLWTKPIEDRDHASLLWPYVRSMVRARSWEIGAQSHYGFTPVLANAAGRKGNFMTTPAWLPDLQRFETPDEFSNRIRADHEKNRGLIERRGGTRPRAYAYPYGDFGQFQARGAFMRQVNLAHVSEFYDLAFVSGNLPVNTRYSDPRRLNRLRVRPEWSGADLLAYLEKAWPRGTPDIDGKAEDLASAWIVDWGQMNMEMGRMSLQSMEGTTGAKMWLAGSDLARDFYARVEFRLFRGQMGLYLRASPDEETYVYLGIDARGEAWLRERHAGINQERPDDDVNHSDLGLWLRQKHPSLERFTLASSATRLEPRDTHTLELYVRDQLLYAVLDGNPMFGTHIRLRGDAKPGMLGISVWDPQRGQARVDIAHVTLQTQSPSLATWADQGQASPHVVQWIHQNSYQLTELSPPWISFSPVGQIMRESWDDAIYDRLARIYHLNLTPRVQINEEEWLARLPPSQLASQATDIGLSGVFVNLEELRNPSVTRVAGWLQTAAASMRDAGVDLLVKLPPALERPATINSILAIAPSLKVVASPTSALQATPQGRALATVQLAQVPEADPEADLPMFYELMALPDTPADQTVQTRVATLEQEGQAAFLDSEYERAITYWSEWQELDTSNPRPLMLIGDAYLRLNQVSTAVEYYDRSLELDPGQISLALRRVRILDDQGMEDEAIASLNLYARLFPDNPQVLLAQAEWLYSRQRTTEARKLMERVLQLDPYNLDALTMVIRLSETSEERQRYLQQISQLGQAPEFHFELGQAIWRHDLLSIPEAHRLGVMVERIYNETREERVRILYGTLRARSTPVKDDPASGWSEDWWVTGGSKHLIGNRLRLNVDGGRTEATVRLLGSERLRDTFVEVTLREWRGAVWLYAFRSGRQMVRFGFEETDRLHMQVWRDGRLAVNEVRSITPLQEGARLRLEARGNGLMGFVDGKPVYDAPIPLPGDKWLGWSGAAIFDARRGQGYMSLDAIQGGPLPMRVAVLPPGPSAQDVDLILDGMREHARHITDLSPRWFTVRADGEWVTHSSPEDRLFRLFGRYHRMRLLPVVEVLSGPDRPVRDVVQRARRHAVDGLILQFNSMPSEEWFEDMREQVGLSRLDIIVMVVDRERDVVKFRALGGAVDFFHGHTDEQPVRLISGSLLDDEFNRTIRNLSGSESVVLLL